VTSGSQLITGITTAVVNNIPLIQYMALVQFNATLDINYGSKQSMCTHYYSQLVRGPLALLIFLFWRYGCAPW